MKHVSPQRGFVLLPVALTLALLALATALLLERGGTGGSVAAAQQQSDALNYAAQAGYAHAKTLLGTWGCLEAAGLPDTPLGAHSYAATMTTSATTPASTFWFTAVADSWLKQDDADKNFGNDKDLKNKEKGGDRRHTVMRFDLTSLPAELDIASVTLHLYVKIKDGTGDPVEIYRIDSSWNENSVNWDDEGDDYDEYLVHGSFVPADAGPLSTDLTRLVRKWVSGAVPNYGLRFISTSNDKESVYASREEPQSSRRPRLEVVTRPALLVDIAAAARDAAGLQRTLVRNVEGPADGILFLDYLDAGYAGNDGSRDWSGGWEEIGENNGTASGAVRVVSDNSCAYGNCLEIDAGLLSTAGVWRQLGLAGAASAILRLHTRRQGGHWTLQVSADGGASWQTLKNTGSAYDDKQVLDVFDISAYAAASTRIRVTSNSLSGGGNKDVYVDDVEVEATCAP